MALLVPSRHPSTGGVVSNSVRKVVGGSTGIQVVNTVPVLACLTAPVEPLMQGRDVMVGGVADKLVVRLGAVNLGSGGWSSNCAWVEQVLLGGACDLVAMCETHLRFGSSYCAADDVCVVSYARQVKVLHHAWGGVALAARRDAGGKLRVGGRAVSRIATVKEFCSKWADIGCFQVDLVDVDRPLYVVVVYLPPVSSDSVCKDDCGAVNCPLVHVSLAIAELALTVSTLLKRGLVVVTGDLNAIPPVELLEDGLYFTADTRRRGAVLYDALVRLGPRLELVNCIGGKASGTRRDPTSDVGRETVLDWMLAQSGGGMTVASFAVRSDMACSDHHLLLATLEVVRGQRCPRLSVEQQLAAEVAAVDASDGVLMQQRLAHVSEVKWRLCDTRGVDPSELCRRREAVRRELEAWWRERRGDQSGGEDQWPAFREQMVVYHASLVRHKLVEPPRNPAERRRLKLVRQQLGAVPGGVPVTLAKSTRKLQWALSSALRKLRGSNLDSRRAAAQAKVDELRASLKVLFRQWRACSRQVRARARAQRLVELRRAIALGKHQVAADIVSAMAGDHDAHNVSSAGRGHKRVEACVDNLCKWMEEIRGRFQPMDVRGRSGDDVVPPVPVGDGVVDRFPELNVRFTVEEVAAAMVKLRAAAAGSGVPMVELREWRRSPELLGVITEYLSDVFTGVLSIPVEFTQVIMTPIVKPGQDPSLTSSYRTLSYGDTLGRVLQALITKRLMYCIKRHRLLHQSQGGFVLDSSNELVMWHTDVVLETCCRQGKEVYQLFVDIRRAFTSTRFSDIVSACERVGITGIMLRFVRNWLVQSTITMVDGSLRLAPIAVLSGCPEGLCFAPVLWCIFMDPLLARIAEVCSVGNVPVVAGEPCAQEGFADDLSIFTTDRAQLDVVVDVLEKFAEERHLELNLSAGKTEVMYRRPLNSALTGIRRRRWDIVMENDGIQLSVCGRIINQVDRYSHMGRRVHARGGRQALKAHLSHVKSCIGMWHHRLARGGMRDMPPELGRIMVLTRVRASWKYGVAVWATAAAIKQLAVQDMKLQKCAVLRSRYLPNPAVHALMGVRSVEAEWHFAVVSLALQLASLPDHNIRRRALYATMMEWRECVQPGLKDVNVSAAALPHVWWTRLHAVLALMDCTEAVPETDPKSPYKTTGVCWVEDMAFVVDANNDVDERQRRLKNMRKFVGIVVEWWDCRRNREEVRVRPSLLEVEDLLSGPLAEAPFMSYPRTVDNMLRVQLRGGMRTVLRLFADVGAVQCPWCGCANMTVPHLLRDCAVWAPHRQLMREKVKSIAVALKLMDPWVMTKAEHVDVSQYWSQQWYLLMVGASVDKTLIRGPVFNLASQGRAHFKTKRVVVRGDVRQAYGEVLRVMGMTLTTIIHETQKHFGIRRFDLDEVYVEVKRLKASMDAKAPRR